VGLFRSLIKLNNEGLLWNFEEFINYRLGIVVAYGGSQNKRMIKNGAIFFLLLRLVLFTAYWLIMPLINVLKFSALRFVKGQN
jgi:uncharacterized MAPEG superfamily protein